LVCAKAFVAITAHTKSNRAARVHIGAFSVIKAKNPSIEKPPVF
jgi:hypothetical protein